MSSDHPFVVLSREAARLIEDADTNTGQLGLHHLPSEEMYVVRRVANSGGSTQVDVRDFATLRWEGKHFTGQWMKKPAPRINETHLDLLVRGADICLSYATFKERLPSLSDPGMNAGLVITYDPDVPEDWLAMGAQTFAAWLVSRDGVWPIPMGVEPVSFGIQQLQGRWPVEHLQREHVAVVGIGSIGGAAAQALTQYGVGAVSLIDPDRFLWHNMVRHVLAHDAVGRYKVDAMRDALGKRWPNTDVHPYRLDVVDDAHVMRSLFADVDLILCAADGIAPRRVVSHLARRASKPAILACVLDDGSIGELTRLRPGPRYGCLLCLRKSLRDRGAIDAEAAQELDYGTGFVHRPMTAVGTDLHLLGQFAAKAAVATLLEAQYGDHTQRLPGDHAIIGLRPSGDMASPFDLDRALQVEWGELPRPRPNCVTCNP